METEDSPQKRFFVEDVKEYHKVQSALRARIPMFTLEGRKVYFRPPVDTKKRFLRRKPQESFIANSLQDGKDIQHYDGDCINRKIMERHAEKNGQSIGYGYETPKKKSQGNANSVQRGHPGRMSTTDGAFSERRVNRDTPRFSRDPKRFSDVSIPMGELRISNKPPVPLKTQLATNPPWRPAHGTSKLFNYIPAQDLRSLLRTYNKRSSQPVRRRL